MRVVHVAHLSINRTVVRVAFIGVPIVVLCYVIVNLSYFTVLSYEQLESAEAVGLVRIGIVRCSTVQHCL